jgi:hypothetical protein
MAAPTASATAGDAKKPVPVETEFILIPPGPTALQVRAFQKRTFTGPKGETTVVDVPGLLVKATRLRIRDTDIAAHGKLATPTKAILEFSINPREHPECFKPAADRQAWEMSIEEVIDAMRRKTDWWKRVRVRSTFLEMSAQLAREDDEAEARRKAIYAGSATKLGGAETADTARLERLFR